VSAISKDNIALAGGIAGQAENGLIANSYNAASVTSDAPSWSSAGGIAGSMVDEYIVKCFNSGPVTAKSVSDSDAGGIAGATFDSERSIIYECYNTGPVLATGTVPDAGGIVGWAESTQIRYCYNIGSVKVTDDGYVGGIIGSGWWSGMEIVSCYFLEGTADGNKIGIIGGTTDEFVPADEKSGAYDADTMRPLLEDIRNTTDTIYYVDAEFAWDFGTEAEEGSWTIDPEVNGGYPTLTAVPHVDYVPVSDGGISAIMLTMIAALTLLVICAAAFLFGKK
jgi:hypothetical protein